MKKMKKMGSVDQSHLPLESELDSPGESELGLRIIADKQSRASYRVQASGRDKEAKSGAQGPQGH